MSVFEIQNFLAILEQKYHKKVNYDVILITGTAGKSTTSHYLNLILQNFSNLKIGLFSKPHITTINERIRVNYIPISNKEFLNYQQNIEEIEKNFNLNLGWFDKLVAIAITYFIDQKVDVAIFEIGIGGMNDSTNALNSLVNIITNIYFEHTDILGKTIKQIATQKAGIIKKNSIVITNASKGLKIIKEKCKQTNSELLILKKIVKIENIESKFPFYTYKLKFKKNLLNSSFPQYFYLKFPSYYLVENFLLALIAGISFLKIKKIEIKELNSDKKIMSETLQNIINKLELPLKTQVIPYKDKKIIIDTAKDYLSLKKLFNELLKQNIKFDVLIAFSKGKEIKLIKKLFLLLANNKIKIYLTEHSVQEKKLTPNQIVKKIFKISSKDEIKKLKNYLRIIEPREIPHILKDPERNLLVTGSLYFCSEIYNNYLQKELSIL
ncbi:MAG: Mur ligase family protein [bacterium]